MTTETECAWAAGFFDGEGNIRCEYKGGVHSTLRLQINQIDSFVLERFKLMAGVGNIGGPYKTPNKEIYKFTCSNQDAILTFDLIKPYLSIPKLVQGENAKQEYYRTRYKK